MRVIELTFQKNARDLGGLTGYDGKKVKNNLIFRGGSLTHVSDEDVKKIRTLGITNIVDFRGPNEFSHKPDYPFENIKVSNFPTMTMKEDHANENHDDSNLLYFLDGSTDGNFHMKKLYKDSVSSKQGIKAYRQFFKMLNGKNVVYFHCSQGKDRAGLAAYLVEKALGVSDEEAKKDYLFSNVAMNLKINHLIDLVKDKEFYSDEYRIALIDVFSAKLEYLDEAINEIKKSYKSIEEYVEKELGVDLDLFRKNYLE